MKRESDILKLISICSANYHNWPDKDKLENTVTLWDMSFSEISLDVLKNAVVYHITTSPYPPKVSDIRTAADHIMNPRTIDAIEAWDKIGTAIRKYGFYRQEEAMESLPHDVAEMARRFTWRELCLCENIDTLRAQFRMAWETQSKRQKEDRLLPEPIRALMNVSGLIKRIQ